MALAPSIERGLSSSLSFSPQERPHIANEIKAINEYSSIVYHPVYWGVGVPRGEGSHVLTIPGFTANDATLFFLNRFLGRIGYSVEPSGILYHRDPKREIGRLSEEVSRLHKETGKRVHVVGHSLGGAVGRGIAHLVPNDVASFTALGSPNGKGKDFEKAIAPTVLAWAKLTVPSLRNTEEFLAETEYLSRQVNENILTSYIFTKDDAVIHYQFAKDYNDGVINIEVPGTHSGLPANPNVLANLAHLLKGAEEEQKSLGKIIIFPSQDKPLEPAA